uniref:Uncharacterized protein n=1 Tax=Oryza brachyantha TaxID=4533 RepID=J3LHQ7_ORYBR
MVGPYNVGDHLAPGYKWVPIPNPISGSHISIPVQHPSHANPGQAFPNKINRETYVYISPILGCKGFQQTEGDQRDRRRSTGGGGRLQEKGAAEDAKRWRRVTEEVRAEEDDSRRRAGRRMASGRGGRRGKESATGGGERPAEDGAASAASAARTTRAHAGGPKP